VLHNELVEETSIHRHGLEVGWEMDGSGGVSEAPTLPGGTRSYQFVVTNCGTYTYHSGTQPWKQIPKGLYGMLVVHCAEEERADRDVSILVNALFVTHNCVDIAATPNYFRFNAHAAPSVENIVATAGERVRIRLANMDAMHHPIHLHGHLLTVLAHGPPLPPHLRFNTTTVGLGSGESVDVMFTARPGIWKMHCHIVDHQVNTFGFYSARPYLMGDVGGMHALVCVSGTTPGGRVIDCSKAISHPPGVRTDSWDVVINPKGARTNKIRINENNVMRRGD